MRIRSTSLILFAAGVLVGSTLLLIHSDEPGGAERKQEKQSRDPATEAIAVRDVPAERPEQRLTEHDQSVMFDPAKPAPLNSALKDQPKQGRITGFDFARDPLNADKPFTPLADAMNKESKARPKVTADQRKLLQARYDLKPKLDSKATMSRGKPLAVGPAARLAEGMTWEKLEELRPDEIKSKGLFPYPSLPHPPAHQWWSGLSSGSDPDVSSAGAFRRRV